MMNNLKSLMGFAASMLCSLPALADGQGVPINYDNISFFEEPLAVGIGAATINANILVDQAVRYNSTTEDDTYNTQVIGDVSIEAELPNSVQVGVNYVGNYDRLAENDENDENDEYTDDVAVYLSDEWGTLAGGNVTGSVREKTRRSRGFGNADLVNDDFVGQLDETGGFYSILYNSYEISITADQEGRGEAGLSFERPIGKSVYFASARLRKGNTTETSEVAVDADTYGGALVAKYTYASFLIAGQLGYELVDRKGAGGKDDHIFGSIGAKYKYESYRFSVEGALGRYDGGDRRAFALGSRVDVARGISINSGLNYNYTNNNDDTTALLSARYEF